MACPQQLPYRCLLLLISMTPTDVTIVVIVFIGDQTPSLSETHLTEEAGSRPHVMEAAGPVSLGGCWGRTCRAAAC